MPSIHDLSSDQRLSQFAKQVANYAVILLDLQGKIIDWSPGAERLMGWSASEAKGKQSSMIFLPSDRDAGVPEAELQTARETGEALDLRWHLRRDGSSFFADGVLSAIHDSHGQLIGFGKILRDNTLGQERSKYLSRQASLLDLAYDPSFSWDFATNSIVYWNKSAEKLYGFTSDEAVNRNPHLLLRTEFPEGLEAVTKNLLADGRWQGELIHFSKDNKKIYAGSRMVLRTDLGIDPVVLETTRDETAEKKILLDLKASERRFRALTDAISKVVLQMEPDFSLQTESLPWQRFTGQSYEESKNFGWVTAVHPDDRTLVEGLPAQAAVLETKMEPVLRLRRHDGDYRWMQMRAATVSNDDGTVAERIAAFSDITDIREAEDVASKSAERVMLATSAANLGIWLWNIDENIVVWENEQMYEIFGMSQDSEPINSERFYAECVHPDDADYVRESTEFALNTGARLELEMRIYRQSDHAIRWVSITGTIHQPEGSFRRIVGTMVDITERKTAEVQLQKNREALELAINATGLGLYDYFPVTGEVHWSAEAKRHFGLSPDAKVDYSVFLQGLHPDDREHTHSLLQRMISMECSSERIHLVYRTIGIEDRQERWIDAWGRTTCDEHGKTVRLVGTTLDITAEKQAEERIRQIALYDPLTNLPNRSLLYEYAHHVFGRARRTGRPSAVLFIDLDRFKPINDNYGHEVGDEVLKEASQRLTKCARSEDFVFRLGGDEFMALLPEIADPGSAGEVARHMAHCLTLPYHVDNLELSLSASIGISIFPRDGEEIETLMNHADSAMYLAKQEGRNNIQFYSQDLALRSEMQSLIEEHLKKAIKRNSFHLHYQPVVDTVNSRLIAVEALLRWPHEEFGPERFVPIAEATGQIHRLGEWVIEEACRQHRKWCESGLPCIPIAINVSSVQFRQKDFIERFAKILKDGDIGTSALQVEVTETALMDNVDHAVDVLNQLRDLGIKIALDDFGTGYSSLSYLSRLPINKIKVDKSFVQRIATDNASRAITEAVIALGRTLNLEVVAEGIESREALHYLRSHGCGQAQGYYVCKPLSAESFEAWYREHGDSLALL